MMRALVALARHAATALIADLNDRSMLSGTVVDLGCGSGITAEVLADAGYHVLGVDLSEPLIRIARARVPAAEFNVGHLLTRRFHRASRSPRSVRS